MPADTTPPAAVPADWKATLAPLLVQAAKVLVPLVVGAVLMYLGVPPKTVEVLVPAPQPLLDLAPIEYEGVRYDGGDTDHHAHPLAAPQASRWPTDRITYGIDYASARGLNPPLPDDAVKAAFRQATGWWSDNLQIEFVEVAFTAAPMVPISFARIDGPQGILAQAYLADGTLSPKPLVMDSSERWTAGPPASGLVSIPTVACHELGHTLGLDHDATNAPAVMRPTYTASLPREQERDVQRATALGYSRRAKVPAGPVDVLSFPVQAKTDDVIQSLQKAGYTVTK